MRRWLSAFLVGCFTGSLLFAQVSVTPSPYVDGAGSARGDVTIPTTYAIVLPSGVPAVTTNKLYNNGGTLTFNGSSIAPALPLTLANGGTGAALTASNGGIFYSNATTGAILAGTATANQVLLSGTSTTPAWSTATYPATTTASQLLYSSSTNTIAGLATAASGVLVTSAGSVPSIATDIPTAVTIGTAYIYRVGGTDVSLADGGTNASLTASNGGIVYSTATAGAILAGTATANQVLLSGLSAAPTWSTATYPATTTANQLLYSSSANTVAGLATANNGVLITGGTGVPSISSTIPTATQDNLTRTGTVTSGTWQATAVDVTRGGHGAAPGADDQVFVSDSTSAGTWRAVTNCTDTGGNHLNYTAATNLISCGTSTSGSSIWTFVDSGDGTVTSGSASNVDFVAISGLTATDVIVVFYEISVATDTSNAPALYNNTDAVTISSMALGTLLAINDVIAGEARIYQRRSGNTAVAAQVSAFRDATVDISNDSFTASTFTTAWTGSWTLALRHAGGAGTLSWKWTVYKVAGQ